MATPVFLLNKNLPAAEEKLFSVVEICTAAERVAGPETMVGAQRIGGLWRLYCKNNNARNDLLTQGLILRGHTIMPLASNPFGGRGHDAEQSTKLIIGNVPLSYTNTDILTALKKKNVEVRSNLFDERGRDENGKLTRWKTGRRFVYIALPPTPLPNVMSVGLFQASLYYREQKAAANCRNCLQAGHDTKACTAPIKCRVCLQDGHKAGDPNCTLAPPPPPHSLNPTSTPSAQESAAVPSMKQQTKLNFEPRSRGRSVSASRQSATSNKRERERSPSSQRNNNTTPSKPKPTRKRLNSTDGDDDMEEGGDT